MWYYQLVLIEKKNYINNRLTVSHKQSKIKNVVSSIIRKRKQTNDTTQEIDVRRKIWLY